MTDQTLCGAVSYTGSPYPCTRELGHDVGSSPAVVRNRNEKRHIAKDSDGRVQMMWLDDEKIATV